MSPQLSLTWMLYGTTDCRLLLRAREGDSLTPSILRSQAQKGACLRIVYQRCCGMDVHKDSVTACLLLLDDEGDSEGEASVRNDDSRTDRDGVLVGEDG
jgi:hypothetical protein